MASSKLGLRTLEYLIKQNADPNAQVLFCYVWILLQFGVGKVQKDDYPLVICYSVLLNMAIEIVSFPIKDGDFP